ncbi:hypothetical protein [Halorubrum lipolyticum]|uniref:Uncharacterized protein n=1 Tax=Halorubrum lipolyticum DSM 21995 TaxID=1227482 RepID=M0NZ88_9EURY|nr:hypothetical protein [Halorubrum lipolyticum]EMA63141.1 hypothetical protein C469_03935 [Halorubrum lipolyticum DSM 21995]
MDPPVVPRERLDGWRRVDEVTERAFAAGPVSVDACTVRYERDASEPPRPFCFASRLEIRPPSAPNPALTALVERQAQSGFRDRLAERDIEGVEHRGDRGISVDDPSASRATLSTFRGVARVGDRRGVPLEALLAVWATDEYLLGGGAYPLEEASYPSGGTPGDARRELLGIVRGIASPGDPAGAD